MILKCFEPQMSEVTNSNISSDSSFDSTVSTVVNLGDGIETLSSATDHRQLRGGRHYLLTTPVKKRRQKWESSCATQQAVMATPPPVVVNPVD